MAIIHGSDNVTGGNDAMHISLIAVTRPDDKKPTKSERKKEKVVMKNELGFGGRNKDNDE